MKQLAALTARYEQFYLCATCCVHALSRECTTKPLRGRLIARPYAGCKSIGSTIHVYSPSRSKATANKWRLG